MVSFFIKKAFFDGWDHLFSLVLLNGVFVVLAALGLFLPGLFGAGSPGFYASLVVVVLLGSMWWSVCVHGLVRIADYGTLEIREMPGIIKTAILPGIQYGVLSIVALLAFIVGLPFYLSRGGIAAALAAGLLLWGGIFFVLAFQWYLPLRARLGGGFAKNLRKSFVFFFDNALFSIFLFVYNAIGALLSAVLAFLLPGLAGLALALDDALRLRLYKYDWLEANPGAKRNAIPWDSLLEEDRELVGKRTIKNMIFPWKY
jgi:hypothetical protein